MNLVFTRKEDSVCLNILPLGRERKFYLMIVYWSDNFPKTKIERLGCVNSPLNVFLHYEVLHHCLNIYLFNGQYDRSTSFDLILTRSFFERLDLEFVLLVRLVNVGKQYFL